MKKQDNFEDKRPTESLADLPLTNEQAEEAKGGVSGTGKTMSAEVIASNCGSTNDIYIFQDYTNAAQNSF